MVLAAVRNSGIAVHFASEELLVDGEKTRIALANHPNALRWARKVLCKSEFKHIFCCAQTKELIFKKMYKLKKVGFLICANLNTPPANHLHLHISHRSNMTWNHVGGICVHPPKITDVQNLKKRSNN